MNIYIPRHIYNTLCDSRKTNSMLIREAITKFIKNPIQKEDDRTDLVRTDIYLPEPFLKLIDDHRGDDSRACFIRKALCQIYN